MKNKFDLILKIKTIKTSNLSNIILYENQIKKYILK